MSKEDFNESWLSESPQRVSAMEIFSVIKSNIVELIQLGKPVVSLTKNLKKIELSATVYYWLEDTNSEMILAGEFGIKPQCLVVNAVGKVAGISSAPFASDLYVAVLHDRKNIAGGFNSVRLTSDDLMTDNGLTIWKQLLNAGHCISVYDKNAVNAGQTHVMLQTVDELEQFFGNNEIYKQYQYILSESKDKDIEVRAKFNTRRLRELSGRL